MFAILERVIEVRVRNRVKFDGIQFWDQSTQRYNGCYFHSSTDAGAVLMEAERVVDRIRGFIWYRVTWFGER
jgi:hypothetical protein